MDCVWLILDSLSFQATPFAADGPNTMPRLQAVAEELSTVFTEAYVPGPYSPSSHAAMLTGDLPSVVGMHEAHPYLTDEVETIAHALRQTHHTSLVSVNPFLFNGLEHAFDTTEDLTVQPYLLFESATDPGTFVERNKAGSRIDRYGRFVFEGGKPVRSLLNGVSYKLWNTFGTGEPLPAELGDSTRSYQYAPHINERIRSELARAEDTFLVANYMDVHPPFDVSDDARSRFLPEYDRAELPIGQNGRGFDDLESERYEQMYKLYLGSIYDLDRELTPLIEDLLTDDVAVFVTADHGVWFGTDPLGDQRLHVPLLVFTPDDGPRTVEHTVNVRSIAATTVSLLEVDDSFAGGATDLLSVSEDQQSITEYVHYGDDDGPVNVQGNATNLFHDLALIEGNTKVVRSGGAWIRHCGQKAVARRLREAGEQLSVSDPEMADAEYDRATEQRLEDLGYL